MNGEKFHHHNKNEWGQWITLPDTSIAFEKTSRGPVYHDRKRGPVDALLNPMAPSWWKPHAFHDIEDKVSINTVKSFF